MIFMQPYWISHPLRYWGLDSVCGKISSKDKHSSIYFLLELSIPLLYSKNISHASGDISIKL